VRESLHSAAEDALPGVRASRVATTQAEKPAATQPVAPAGPAEQRPRGKITLPAKVGALTFDHGNHAGKLGIACTTCHHPSRPQKPPASETQACRDCHKQKGGSAPVKCVECHKKK
jgi:hypothetical protein